MKIAIVTGASSGLGEEYLKCLACGYPEIEEIWIVARRADRLEKLAESYKEKRIVPFPLDLTDTDSFEKMKMKLENEKPDVKILINNAGFGTLGSFSEQELSSQTRMIDLNNRALTAITLITLPYMNKGSFVLNVCSIAAFAPTARMSVYCSTKSFVYSFSKALRFELKSKGINVLAACPGPMDTEFLPAAGINKGSSHTFDTLPRCNTAKVAKYSLKKAAKGCGKYTPTLFYKFYRLLAKILPHSVVMHMSKT